MWDNSSVFTQAAGPVEINPYAHVAETHISTTAKGVIEVYPGRLFYNTIANLGRADVSLPKNQKVGEGASAPQEIVHNKDELFL